MKSAWIFAAATAAVLVAAPALAGNDRGHGHGRHGGGHQRGAMALHMLHAADANGDRSVTRAEVADLQNEMFDWLDRNADGVLNAEDRSPMARRMAALRAEHHADDADADDAGDGERRGRRGRRGRHHGGWAHLDQNDDDAVSREEFTSRQTQMFDELDADSDGVITPDEIDARMEERQRDHQWWRQD